MEIQFLSHGHFSSMHRRIKISLGRSLWLTCGTTFQMDGTSTSSSYNLDPEFMMWSIPMAPLTILTSKPVLAGWWNFQLDYFGRTFWVMQPMLVSGKSTVLSAIYGKNWTSCCTGKILKLRGQFLGFLLLLVSSRPYVYVQVCCWFISFSHLFAVHDGSDIGMNTLHECVCRAMVSCHDIRGGKRTWRSEMASTIVMLWADYQSG